MAAPTASPEAGTQPIATRPASVKPTTAASASASAETPQRVGAQHVGPQHGSTVAEPPGDVGSAGSTETATARTGGAPTATSPVGTGQDANATSAATTSSAADDVSAEHGTTAIPDETAWTPPSWDEVVRVHADRVYRLAFRLSGNQHDAEDLTQETFIRVFRSLASYKPGTFEGWLHRITTNLFLDLARRRSRLRMEGLPEDTDRLPSSGRSPEQVYHETHLDPDLQKALDELPPEFRAAVVLCDVEGLSYEEIGATLGVKLGTVRSRIHRGRQMLKAALETRREHAREDSE